MKSKITLLLAAFVFIFNFTAVIASESSRLEDIEKITIKYNAFIPPTHSAFKVLNQYFNQVEEKSKGKITFDVYAGGLLLKAKESLRGLSNGTVNCALITTTYFPSYLPKVCMLSDMLLITDDASATTGTSTQLLLNSGYFDDECKKNNIFMAGGLYSTKSYRIISREPIRSLEDIKGKKIRTAGGTWVRLAKNLGATTVSMPISEAYEGLQRGTLDGVFGSVDFLNSYSLWEVAKYVTEIPIGCYCGTCALAFNLDFWEKLPKVAKKILLENMAFVPAGISIISYSDREDETRSIAPDHGVKFIEPEDDLINAINNLKAKEKYAAMAKAVERGVDKEEAEMILDDYVKYYDKWEDLSYQEIRGDVEKLTQRMQSEIYDNIIK